MGVGPTYDIGGNSSPRRLSQSRIACESRHFTFTTFMSQATRNICDTNNLAIPYSCRIRLKIAGVRAADFAVSWRRVPKHVSQPARLVSKSFAVSKTNDPVSGGWNYYSIN